MSEWVVCGSCQLKHQLRPDGRCPRCKATIGGVSASAIEGPPSQYAPPRHDESADAPLPEGTVPTGARIAGGIFIANGVLTLLQFAGGFADGGPATGGASVISPIFDFVIGGSLIANQSKWLQWAKIRVVLGLVLFSIISFSGGDVAGGVVQIVFSASLMLLLFGNASRPRIAIGSVMSGLVLMLALLGTFMDSTGTNPLGGLTYSGQTEPVPGGVVTGQLRPYKLTLPNADWLLRKDEFAKGDNELADRWVIRPDVDAHVMVVVEELDDGGYLDVNAYQNAVIENIKATSQNFKLIHDSPAMNGIVFKSESTIQGMQVNHLIRLYVDKGVAVQVTGFAPVAAFPAQEGDIRAILDSFRF
jgi:hypothetical protein